MANYWVDHIQGWLSGNPAEVIAAKRDLQHLIDPKNNSHDVVGGIVAAFDKITDKQNPQQRTYQRAWDRMAAENTHSTAKIKTQNKPKKSTHAIAELSGMMNAYKDMHGGDASSETIHFGDTNPKLFLHAAEKSAAHSPTSTTAYDAMSTVSEKIFQNNAWAYAEPAGGLSGGNTIARQQIGGTISMSAARGYSRLGNIDSCEKTLRTHKNTYGYPNGNFATFVEKQGKISENKALLVAAVRIENGKDLSLETMQTILKSNTFDDKVNEQLIESITAIAHNTTHYNEKCERVYNPASKSATEVLINHVRDYKPECHGSKSKAFQALGSGSTYVLKKQEFEMIHEEIAQNNTAVMEYFSTQGEILNFVDRYNRFQYDAEDNRVETSIKDALIPSDIKGENAAKARNHLVNALIGKPKDYYKVTNHREIQELPSAHENTIMNAAITLTTDVLQDPTLDINHPEIIAADHTMCEIMLAQDIARKKAHNFIDKVENGENKKYDFYRNHKDMLEEKLTPVDTALSAAADRVTTLAQNHDHTATAQKILDNKNRQWKALFGDEPTPLPISTRFNKQFANELQ